MGLTSLGLGFGAQPASAGDFPAVSSVIEGDTTDGAAGTYHQALPSEVRAGVWFGPSSSYLGNLEEDVGMIYNARATQAAAIQVRGIRKG
jgi:hypothetical protein